MSNFLMYYYVYKIKKDIEQFEVKRSKMKYRAQYPNMIDPINNLRV